MSFSSLKIVYSIKKVMSKNFKADLMVNVLTIPPLINRLNCHEHLKTILNLLYCYPIGIRLLLLFPLFCLEHIFDYLDPIADPFIENKFGENILSQWPYILWKKCMWVVDYNFSTFIPILLRIHLWLPVVKGCAVILKQVLCQRSRSHSVFWKDPN